MNIYLKGSLMSTVPLLCGTYQLSQIEQSLINRPDIVLDDRKEETCLLIGIAIPDDSNVNTEETEKLRKYKDLMIEFSRM
jgi:hypothetical protein